MTDLNKYIDSEPRFLVIKIIIVVAQSDQVALHVKMLDYDPFHICFAIKLFYVSSTAEPCNGIHVYRQPFCIEIMQMVMKLL